MIEHGRFRLAPQLVKYIHHRVVIAKLLWECGRGVQTNLQFSFVLSATVSAMRCSAVGDPGELHLGTVFGRELCLPNK